MLLRVHEAFQSLPHGPWEACEGSLLLAQGRRGQKQSAMRRDAYLLANTQVEVYSNHMITPSYDHCEHLPWQKSTRRRCICSSSHAKVCNTWGLHHSMDSVTHNMFKLLSFSAGTRTKSSHVFCNGGMILCSPGSGREGRQTSGGAVSLYDVLNSAFPQHPK